MVTRLLRERDPDRRGLALGTSRGHVGQTVHRKVSLWSFAQRLCVTVTPDQRELILNLTLDLERKFPLYPDFQLSPQRAGRSSGF